MQPLGERHRLPRVIAATGADDLGGLRPGRDRVTATSNNAARHPMQEPARAPWGWMGLIVLTGIVLSLFHLPHAMKAEARGLADRVAVAAGFAVDHVAVVGHNNTPMSEIVRVLDLDTDRSLLAYNREDVSRKLRGLRWVDSVRVVHILPDTVSIEITERTPFAIWQNKGRYFLVDRGGHTLSPFNGPVPDARFPLVVGKGAGMAAGALMEAMARHQDIKRRVKAYVRVADRRWTLVFNSGKKIFLPEVGIRTALTTLDVLLSTPATSQRNVSLIDLRIPARPTMRLNTATSRQLDSMKRARRAAARILSGKRS